MKPLSKEQVLHVARLARLNVSDAEVEKYGIQLAEIMSDVDKIIDVDIDTNNILIAPTDEHDRYNDDQVGDMLNKEEIFKNVNHESDGYVVVPRVVNE